MPRYCDASAGELLPRYRLFIARCHIWNVKPDYRVSEMPWCNDCDASWDELKQWPVAAENAMMPPVYWCDTFADYRCVDTRRWCQFSDVTIWVVVMSVVMMPHWWCQMYTWSDAIPISGNGDCTSLQSCNKVWAVKSFDIYLFIFNITHTYSVLRSLTCTHEITCM